MKKSIVIISLLTCLIIPEYIEAGQLTTDFAVKVTVGNITNDVNIPTPANMRIALPSIMDDWNCTVTNLFISNDGKSKYRNVACINVSTSIVFGISISCPSQKEGKDYEQFFMRSGDANIGFDGWCQTYQVGTKPDMMSPHNISM
jgi:hypothetical protein